MESKSSSFRGMEGEGSDPSSLVNLSTLSAAGNNTYLPPFSLTWNSFHHLPPPKQSIQSAQVGQPIQPQSQSNLSQSQNATSLLSEISRLSQPSGMSSIIKEPDSFNHPICQPSSQLPLSQFPTITSSQTHVVSSSQYALSQTSKITFPIPSSHSIHRDRNSSKSGEISGFSQHPPSSAQSIKPTKPTSSFKRREKVDWSIINRDKFSRSSTSIGGNPLLSPTPSNHQPSFSATTTATKRIPLSQQLSSLQIIDMDNERRKTKQSISPSKQWNQQINQEYGSRSNIGHRNSEGGVSTSSSSSFIHSQSQSIISTTSTSSTSSTSTQSNWRSSLDHYSRSLPDPPSSSYSSSSSSSFLSQTGVVVVGALTARIRDLIIEREMMGGDQSRSFVERKRMNEQSASTAPFSSSTMITPTSQSIAANSTIQTDGGNSQQQQEERNGNCVGKVIWMENSSSTRTGTIQRVLIGFKSTFVYCF